MVDIPSDKGVHAKTAGAKGEKYVYKYVRYFRNENGEPRNQAKAIGKVASTPGKMYPNANYFEMYHTDSVLPDVSIWNYGYTYLIQKTCRDIGLTDCLSNIFGKSSSDILVMAAYMLEQGSIMDGIDDWQIRHYFPENQRLLTSQSTSNIFSRITQRQRQDFFKQWVSKGYAGGSVCYDVTSISSYSEQMPTVERGYNRDGEDLAQYNLGMFCDESTRTPLYYNRYNGSLTDRTNLSYVLENAKSVGIHRVKMILDGGFWSPECFASLQNSCDAFTVGMPMFLKESENILREQGAGIEKYVNEVRGHRLYSVSVEKEIHGVSGRVLLYYSAWNHANQCEELSALLGRLDTELRTLKRYPKSKLKKYTPYFRLTKHQTDSGFDYCVDVDTIEKLRETKGYFLLFTTDKSASAAEILDAYRAKDADEKIFSQLKVDMDGNRIRTHTEETTDGKTFVTFVACVIRAHLLSCLSDYLTDQSTSMKKVFNQLSNITILSGYNGYRFTKALTKSQKQILDAFDAADDIMKTVNFLQLR